MFSPKAKRDNMQLLISNNIIMNPMHYAPSIESYSQTR